MFVILEQRHILAELTETKPNTDCVKTPKSMRKYCSHWSTVCALFYLSWLGEVFHAPLKKTHCISINVSSTNDGMKRGGKKEEI